jgi:DNA-binding MarR family transcriptional regulator
MVPSDATPSNAATADQARAKEVVRALARVSSFLEKSSTELSLAHYRVLSAISSGDERASRIASRLALGKPAISAAVNSLSQRGLLTRVDVEGDLRATHLRLTPKGRAVLARAETDMVARLDQVAARVADPSAVMDSLLQLATAIEEVRAERAAARSGATGAGSRGAASTGDCEVGAGEVGAAATGAAATGAAAVDA